MAPVTVTNRNRRRAVLAACVVLVTGCRTYHYAVVRDGAPLFAAPSGGALVARLPRLHHEVLGDEPDREGGRVEVAYFGQRGWARAGDVRVFGYRDPELDGGRDRWVTVQRELRELRLADVGATWPPAVVAAVREGRVTRGMTREQVELALGWPDDIVRGPFQGTERWVYRTTEEVDLPLRRPPFLHPPGLWHGWHGDPLWWDHHPFAYDPYAYDPYWAYRVAVVHEMRIEFDAADWRVTAVEGWRRLP